MRNCLRIFRINSKFLNLFCSYINSHLNAAVRSCAAKQLYNLVLRSGADLILSNVRGITDRAIPAIARFAQDSCPEAR